MVFGARNSRLSTRSRYAVRILLELGLNDDDKPKSLDSIGKAQGLSIKYIGQFATILRKSGFIESFIGKLGGYRLARSPKNITILEIIELMEGPFLLCDCLQNPKCCKCSPDCQSRLLWRRVNDQVRAVLSGVTLQDVIDEYITPLPETATSTRKDMAPPGKHISNEKKRTRCPKPRVPKKNKTSK